VASVCLRGKRDAEQIEGAVLCGGGGGKDGGEAIAPEADDIAGEGGEIAEQAVKAVHRERFAIYWLGAPHALIEGEQPRNFGETGNAPSLSPSPRSDIGKISSSILRPVKPRLHAAACRADFRCPWSQRAR
jgi:hypothetical protein